MKTTQTLIMAAFLVTMTACSKQEHTEAASQAPKIETPAIEKPMVAKPTAMLPNEINASDMSGANVEQDTSGKKVIYWEDPMVEGRHFNHSGKSPFMDMQLAPRYEK